MSAWISAVVTVAVARLFTRRRWPLLMSKVRRCAYCGQKFSKTVKKTLDHILSIKAGGAHALDNLAVCCRSCNCSKQAMAPEQWAARMGLLLI